MKFQVIKVTPEMAQKWLSMNGANRELRPRTVLDLNNTIKRGEWKTSHQAIAISKDGHVIDGQHRLQAIADSGMTVEAVVCFDADPNTFDVLDIGIRRTIADITGNSKAYVGTINFIAGIVEPNLAGRITPQKWQNYDAIFGDATQELTDFCPIATKVFSQGAVKAAAVLRMMSGGDDDYIKLTYYQLNHKELSSLSPIATAFVRQYMEGRVGSKNDLFVRAWKVFDKDQSRTTKIQIKDLKSQMEEAREVVRSIIKDRSRTNAGKKLYKDIQASA